MNQRVQPLWPLVRCAIAFGILVPVVPAAAQWSQVTEVPTGVVYTVWAHGDTIAAGADTVVHLSTDAGATWRHSARPAVGVTSVQALWMRNGRLYAGTFGQGAFVSDDLGATWQAFNEGLVGGLFDSQLDLTDFQVRGDTLCAATAGAGVYARGLAGPAAWAHFGDVFEPEQASNVNGLALGGNRLLASAGSNGMVFHRDPGEPDWTESDLDNVGVHAGLSATSAAWNGVAWVVGTNAGIFRSAAGEEPWTRIDPALGTVLWTSFATLGRRIVVAFELPIASVVETSDDDGATWGDAEVLPGVSVFKLAAAGGSLYAARADGLWRRPADTVSVPAPGGTRTLSFAAAGPQPFADATRLRFDLPEAGRAIIEVFDAQGRADAARLEGWWAAGPHQVTLDAGHLRPGVLFARLTACGTAAVVRLVHLR